MSVVFEDSAKASKALTNAPCLREFEPSSPHEEKEKEGPDQWYRRRFCEEGKVVALKEVEPLGR